MRRAEKRYWLVFAISALVYSLILIAAFRWMVRHNNGG